jgi:hypothetical protein
MSELVAGLLLLPASEPKPRLLEELSVMSTRSRNRSNPRAVPPPLVGRLHELATTRPVTTPVERKGWWQQPGLAGEGLIRNPQVAVFGSLGRGRSSVRVPSSWLRQGGSQTALMRRLYLDALRFSGRPVIVFDEAASVEPFDLSSVTDPLSFVSLQPSPATDPSGEW